MLKKMTSTTGTAFPDAEIVARIASGDPNAFVLLMRRFNRPLYRAARSILKDDAEAEDVLQEAYLRIYRSITSYRGEAKLLTWLTRIVVNEAIARLRKTVRRAEVIQLGRNSDDAGVGGNEVNENNAKEPERAAMRAEARALLEKKIDALPDIFRIVFVLRAIEEISVEEVAACLSIPEATVRTRFFRARGLLRESLSLEFDFALEDAFSFDGVRCDRIVASALEQLQNTDQKNIGPMSNDIS